MIAGLHEATRSVRNSGDLIPCEFRVLKLTILSLWLKFVHSVSDLAQGEARKKARTDDPNDRSLERILLSSKDNIL